MTGPELATLLDAALVLLADARDELRALDAATGDGDLGFTVEKSVAAVRARLAELSPETSPADLLKQVATTVAAANPSSLSALVAGGLLRAASTVRDADQLGRAEAANIVRAVADSIAERGKSAVGDKTILDAISPSGDALDAGDADAAGALRAMIEAAKTGIAATTPLASTKGRASWVGERGAGSPDAGATAYLRLLEALAASWPASAGG